MSEYNQIEQNYPTPWYEREKRYKERLRNLGLGHKLSEFWRSDQGAESKSNIKVTEINEDAESEFGAGDTDSDQNKEMNNSEVWHEAPEMML
jgi:hypothetical protein